MNNASDVFALMIDIDDFDLLRIEKEYSELSASGRRDVVGIMKQLLTDRRNDYVLKAEKFTKVLEMFDHYEVTTQPVQSD